MAYKMKGFSGFGNSPVKQKSETWPAEGTKPRKVTPEEKETDKKTIKKFQEVYKKDWDKEKLGPWPGKRKKPSPQSPEMIEKRTKDFDKKSKDPNYTWGKSPAKQEGPTPEKNPILLKGEMEGTWVYEGKNKNERIADLEDRAGFLTENDIPDLEGSTDPKDIKRVKTLKATVKKLQHEADILRNRKPKK